MDADTAVSDEGSPADTSIAAPDTPTPGGGEGGLLKALDDSKKNVESEPVPLRQDKIANAIAFLTNPKVAASSSGAKRSFLLTKGLTDEEIDSAVEQAKSIVPVPAAVPVATVPTQPAPLASQPAPSQVAMANGSSTEVQPTPMGDVQASWMRITAAVVLVGFATVGVGSVAMPYLKKGWRWFMGTDTDDSDDSDAKKLTDVLDKHAEQQQELFKQVKDVATAVKTLQENKEQQSPADSRASAQLDALRNDVTALNAAVAKNVPIAKDMSEIKTMLQRQTPSMSRQSSGPFLSPPSEAVSSSRRAAYPDPLPSTAADRAAAASRPLFATPVGTPNTSTFPSGAVVGSNGNNGTSHSYSPHSSPPAVTFGSGGMPGNTTFYTPPPAAHPRHSTNGNASGASNGAGRMHAEASGVSSQQMASNITDGSEPEPPHPPEFYNVLEMVSKGMTPAGVRSDIVDSPPDPTRAPTPPSMPRKPKPWEQSATSRTPDLQGALRAAAESGLGVSPQSEGSPFQGSSSIDRENGMRLRQQVSEGASLGQVAPAVTSALKEVGILEGDKRESIRAHAITAFTRPPSEDLSETGDDVFL